MGFLSKAFKRVKKQIRPNNMMIGNIRKMPRRRGGFLRGMSMMKPSMGDMRFRGRMPRRGGFGNLRNLVRRLKEQRDMGMPRMPSMDFGDQIGYKRPNKNPDAIAFDNPSFRMIGTPQPIPERMPVSNAPSFNPTIFGQPIGDMDFSNMPDFSQMDLTNLQAPTQMPMTQDLPEVSPIGMMAGRTLQQDFPAERRMMMAEGDEVIDRSPEQELFSLQAQLENLQKQLEMDRSYNDLQTIVKTSAEIDAIQKRMAEIQMEMARQKMIGENPYNLPFDPDAKAAREKIEEEGRPALEEEYRNNPYNYPFNKISIEERKRLRPQLAEGGEPFPDLSGDGQITRKDILMGQGVKFKAEGGEMMTQENEIDAMLGGMDSEEAGAMEDLEQMAPEMEMIDQLVMMVVQMIQQGASEEEVMMFLREQGLDDEDIGTVLQLVAEMAEAEAMPQDGIGAELEQLA